ncbi:MAG: beta-N-acetylhexosaminidase family protein, partial [Planctomycetota bacterium]
MEQKLKLTGKTLFLVLLFAVLFCQQVFSQTIVYPTDGSDLELLAAKEVRRYIYLCTDQLLSVQGVTSLPGTGDLIVVADEDDPLISGLSIGDTTGPQGFIIKSLTGARNVLVITGNDSAATLHAAYRYAEHLGVGFDLANDAIPDARITLDITGLDEKGEPLFPTNGFLPFHDFYHGPDIWSTADYKSFISQIAKLGMNFIGLHTYPTWSTTDDKNWDDRQGPEPHVWIGLQGDYDANGNVSWSYPGYYRHTATPHLIWAHETLNTDQFRSGTSQLFDRNQWGSDIFGNTMPSESDMAAWNDVWNRSGQMLKEAFGHAKAIGVKTALGTELTMGLEPAGPEVTEDWARVMPPALQSRVSNPYDPDTVRSVYKAIFERIMNTHDLDYFWLWSYEIWSYFGVTQAQIDAFKNDILRADEALAELGRPFQIGHAGWILGSIDNPAEFDSLLPPEAPFCGLWDEADKMEQLQPSRVKWPATWLEEDWGLGQPQIEVNRLWRDVTAAWNKSCDGMIAKHWRTKSLLANAPAMKDILWVYGPTGAPLSKGVPSDEDAFIDAAYLNWATRQFGPEAAQAIADILSAEDTKGDADQGAMPKIMDWEGPPGAITENSSRWGNYSSNFEFVDNLVALRPQIVGAGNLDRYDYLLACMESFKLMAEYGCVRDDYMTDLSRGKYSDALVERIAMARLFEQFQTKFAERIVNTTDLGAIIHHEIVNWYMLVEQETDRELRDGLGTGLPSDAYPTSNYLGKAFVKVVPAVTQVKDGEALTLKVIIMDNASSATLHYRILGGGSYTSTPLTNIARGVYEVTIPAQADDYEYYIEAQTAIGDAKFPVTAPAINQTVVVTTAGEPLPPDTDPPTPDPMEWATVPYATSESSIAMVAVTASDPSGVQYYFDETTGNPGGTDSGWQASPSYTDTGLNAGTQYCYEVAARDLRVNQNETAASSNQCATTTAPDTTPPMPDPMTWASVPNATGETTITMTATT